MKKTKKISILMIILSVFLITMLFLTIRKLNNKPSSVNNTKEVENIKASSPAHVAETPVENKEDTPVELLITSVGDCTIGYDDKFSFNNSLPYVFQKHNKDFSYFFKNVYSIFKDDDITTANLETTFTKTTNKADKEFTFKADPEYAKVISSSSIEAVNISNNHIYDYGTNGFKDTLSSLKSENINYFGEGNVYIKNVKGINIAFLGYRGFYYDNNFLKQLKNDINRLKKQDCFVIINFHWGDENSYSPNSTQKYIAHYAVDNGADLIIGHHPHVIQGIEQYKNKFICYSLGNFCFGGNINPTDKDTFIFQTKLKFNKAALISQAIRVIPCSISSVNYINDYCPTPMEGQNKSALLTKLNNLSPHRNFKLSDEFISFDAK